MTIQELIDRLETAEDKTIEVVVRTQNNGANIVQGTSYWSAIPATASHHSCDVLLPDSDNGERNVLIINA